MTWYFQSARVGNYRLQVWRTVGGWTYRVFWQSETAMTIVGSGSEAYHTVLEAREAAVLHLANILPKPQSQRLLATQGELPWEPDFDRRNPRKRGGQG